MSTKLTRHVNDVINTTEEAFYQPMKNLSLATTLLDKFLAPRFDYGNSCRCLYTTTHCQPLFPVFIENYINLVEGQ